MLNSLYGRFGMNPYLNKHSIIDSETHLNLMDKFNIIDVIPLQNNKELISYTEYNQDEFIDNDSLVNVAIAATITAAARVYMSKFKNMNDITLYYSDTDSIDVDKPLDFKYIGNDLGQLKLEHIFEEAIYLAPKVYGGKTNDYEYIKIKGLKNPIPFNDLKSLLKRGKFLEISNEKWYKSLSKGNITIKDEIYTLAITDSKRNLIYDNNNIFADTEPIILN